MTNFFDVNSNEVNAPVIIEENIGVLWFNWVNLADCWDIAPVDGDNVLDLGNVNLETYFSPRSDWWWVLAHNVQDKQINLSIYIQWDNKVEYEKKVDDIKQKITTTNWDLDLVIAWELRRVKASVTQFTERDETKDKENIWLYDISFVTVGDFTKKDNTSITFTNINADLQTAISNKWSKWTYPNIYFILNSWSVTWLSVEINGFKYTLPASVSAWDVLILYGENQDKIKEQNAFINWNIINTKWRYPFLDKGDSNIIKFEFDWWPFDFDVTFVYKQKYY